MKLKPENGHYSLASATLGDWVRSEAFVEPEAVLNLSRMIRYGRSPLDYEVERLAPVNKLALIKWEKRGIREV